GAASSVVGKRLGEDRPLLGHIVYILGLVLIAVGHGWAINWAYVRLAGHQRRASTPVARTRAHCVRRQFVELHIDSLERTTFRSHLTTSASLRGISTGSRTPPPKR